MSHGELIGSPTDGESENLGARLARFFRSPRSTGDRPAPAGGEPQETVEFVPEDVEPTEGEWTPRFAMVWRGYDRLAVDEYIRELEDELAAVRAEHTPEHAIRAEIDRIGDDTAEILRVAQEKADAIASRAHAQADLLVAQAEADAEMTTRDAEQRRRRLDADAELIWRERTRLIDDTRGLADCMLSVADDAAERFPAETEEPVVAPAEATDEPPVQPVEPPVQPDEPPVQPPAEPPVPPEDPPPSA